MLPSPIGALCVFVFLNTFSIGAFPVLLPEIGRGSGTNDIALGAIAGAFGFARLVADIPAGLFITHHLRRAIVLCPCALCLGLLCLTLSDSTSILILGRALIGIGHALGMVGGITAILRHGSGKSHSFSLSAFEMSGMLGVLCGMVIAGSLPKGWSWNVAFGVASAPQLVSFFLLPGLLKSIPSDATGTRPPLFARVQAHGAQSGKAAHHLSKLTLLAFATGAAIALAWSAVGQFVLPIRASREFGLSREGVAWTLSILQFVDVLFLLPVGIAADRFSRTKVLGFVLIVMAVGVSMIALGPLPFVVVGSVLVGFGLAGWMLPVSLLHRNAPADRLAWRTALYRLGVDSGIFLGPVLSGFLGVFSLLWIVGVACSICLLVLAAFLLLYRDVA